MDHSRAPNDQASNASMRKEAQPNIAHDKYTDIVTRFTNHIPDNETVKAMAKIRKKVRELAFMIEEMCPESREKATALTQLSFVMMSANSAIVQKCPVNVAEL